MRVIVAATCAAALAFVPAAPAAPPLQELVLSADVSLDRPADTEGEPGVLLLDAVAHSADVLAFYQDRVATEAFLDTARGDGLTLQVSFALGSFTVRCAVADDGTATGPCAAQGVLAGAGSWTGSVDRAAGRVRFELRLAVVCPRCPSPRSFELSHVDRAG